MDRFSLEVFSTIADFHDYLHRKQLTRVQLFQNLIPFLSEVSCRILLRSDGDEVIRDNFLVTLSYCLLLEDYFPHLVLLCSFVIVFVLKSSMDQAKQNPSLVSYLDTQVIGTPLSPPPPIISTHFLGVQRRSAPRSNMEFKKNHLGFPISCFLTHPGLGTHLHILKT